MSAERLREAAALMRSRAELVSESPWSSGGVWWEHWTDPEGRKCHTPWPTVTRGTGAEIVAKTPNESLAEHIASWPPAVALAVADSLNQAAAVIEEAGSGPLAMAMCAIAEPLVAVADTYLGAPA